MRDASPSKFTPLVSLFTIIIYFPWLHVNSSMSEPANPTGSWERFLRNGPSPSPSICGFEESDINRIGSASSQSSSDGSQSTVDIDNPEPSLNWTPKVICAKGTTDRYWIVENTRRCSDFCKDQLKVIHSVVTANARMRSRGLSGPLRPRNLRQHGLNFMKLFIVNTSFRMSFANIVDRIFNIRTPVTTKVHPP